MAEPRTRTHLPPESPPRRHSDESLGSVVVHEELHRGTLDAAAAAAITALRAAGERVTDPRRAVLEVLAGRIDHLSADQVATILETAPHPVHRATVYRTLDRLAEIGIATPMQVAGGATVYHLASTPSGHEHLHARCRSCGTIAVLPLEPLDVAARRMASTDGFRLEPAQSTLVGLCAECAGS